MRRTIIISMVLSLFITACYPNNESVVFEYFPDPWKSGCTLEPESEKFRFSGYHDFFVRDNYHITFQVRNNAPNSAVQGMGSKEAPIGVENANMFIMKTVNIEYHYPSYLSERGLNLINRTEGEAIRIGNIINTDKSVAAGSVPLFGETHPNYRTLRDFVESNTDIEWDRYPIILKVWIEGEMNGNGKTVKTNSLEYRFYPQYGSHINPGGFYYVPTGGFPNNSNEYCSPEEKGTSCCAAKVEQAKILEQCTFEDPVEGGCFGGQDGALVNCYFNSMAAGDYENYMTQKYAADGGNYVCCPPEPPSGEPQSCEKSDD
ncbi:MAG: hypothetical protein R6W70_05700 [bacterium]